MRLDGAPTREPLPTASIVGHRPARGPTVPRIPFLLSRIGSVRRGRGFPVRRGSLAVPSNLRLPNARSERLGVPKPPIRASRPPRIEGVDAVRIGPNASTRTGCLGFGAADVRSGGVLGKRAASGGVAHGEGAVSMSTRAHRGTSRVFWKPIRAPECRPDRQKCRPRSVGKRALALPQTRREPQCKRGPGQVDAIAARADAATNALGSPAEHTEGCSTGTLRRHPRHRLPRGFPGLTHDRLRIGGLYR